MSTRMLQLVLHYDGTDFSGWQRQPDRRTVQGAMEEAASRLCAAPITVLGAGRTDAGVHARGQVAGIRVPERWQPERFHRAMNAVLPDDIWVHRVIAMQEDFHARYSAVARRYRYHVGTDDLAQSPFRRRAEWSVGSALDASLLRQAAALIEGTHVFRAFAVRGTAPATDDHRCSIALARWLEREGGLVFEVEANRFLHHMVRFLVGTMTDIAAGRRPLADLAALLEAPTNDDVSRPAPAHGLFLEEVRYPSALYLDQP